MSFIQPGDVINVTKLAWQIYETGWSPELRARTQYAQFGSEFRLLAKNLDVLVSVITQAQESLRSHGVRNSGQVRWDRASLVDIVGDFHATVKECEQLLEDNRRHGTAPNNPLRNIEWNVLVQPTANRLRERIQLHSARIQTVLKPFEIDLLTRIHDDLARRITAVQDDVHQVHIELRSLIGVLVPSLHAALEQKEALQIRLLPVPPEMEQEFERIFHRHPAWQDEQHPPLRDMSLAFITSLEQSTKCFEPGMTVIQKMPSVDQYLNLHKCLFLMKKMEASDELGNAGPQSHWPSYVKELEERLFRACDEFSREMTTPPFQVADIDDETLNFWIEETRPDLIDTVTIKVMMEELMEIPLFTHSPNISQSIRLMRHTGTRDKRYRLVISATEKQTSGPPRQQREVVDFDVTSATINPLYALSPGTPRAPYEMILQANHKIHRLAFSALEDAFLFQQGITGFKVVDNYSVPHAKVSFVIEDQGGSILENASAQIWIQRRLGGSLAPDNSDSPSPIDTPPSPIPIAGAPIIMSSTSPHTSAPEFGGPPQFGSPESISAEFGSMGLSSSPGKMSTRPDMASRSSNTPPMASSARFASSPNRPQTLAPSGPLSTSPGQDSTSSGSFMSKILRKRKPSQDQKARTLSVSSNATTATSVTIQSNSSSTSDTTVAVLESGKTKTAPIHANPLKPMLVLFTRGAETSHRAIVAISIDEKTTPNPQGCYCHQGVGPDGTPCKITVVEQSGGKKVLEARRLYSSTGQWDLLPLCASRRNEKRGFAGAKWRDLNRVSILFPSVEARLMFGGRLCTCRRQTKGEVIECMRKGHVGLLGQVRVHYRNEAEKYFNGRFKKNTHVLSM